MPCCGVACSVGLEPHDIIVTSLPVGAASAFEPRDIGTGQARGEGSSCGYDEIVSTAENVTASRAP